MIRLFIAIDIPKTAQREIEGMGRSIRNSRAVPPDQLHLTLKFLGEVESSRLYDIDEVLQTIRVQNFSLCLKGVGTFPPRGTPRVLWAGVAPVDQILLLRKSIERNLDEIGIARDKKKFTPHLTLARLRNSPIKQLQQFLAGNAFLQTPEFQVDSFHLYSSKLSSKGALHTLERSYSLI